MLKLFLGVFFITTLLSAEFNEKNCKTDLNNMISLYYVGEKAYDEKDYKKALIKFQASSDASYCALKNCEDTHDYNFEIMYNYILESENKIYKIQEEMLK